MNDCEEDDSWKKDVWYVDPLGGVYVIKNSRRILCSLHDSDDAHRIANCMNACSGMEIPFNTVVRNSQFKAKLLAELKRCVDLIENVQGDEINWWITVPDKGGIDLVKINELIATVTKYEDE